MVRAVSSSGLASPQPAEVSFSILPPFWRSWWFMACALFFVIGLAVFFERQRVRRLIEIEKVRARIATDLHDDIGSGLTHIGLLSEVTLRKFRARHQSESAAPPTKASVESEFVSDDLLGSVEHVGIIARELAAAMSDVVWSINPKHDSLDALVNRFSGFAHEMCKAKHIELRFTVSENIHRLKLNPETRRNVLLIAKEALNNMAKYSESPAVDVQIRIHENALEISVQDYGIGFDVSTPGHGNGLVNIRTRAQKIGGRSEINSEIGKGAQVRVVVPVS
jgi:signal transduction histidine kinase